MSQGPNGPVTRRPRGLRLLSHCHGAAQLGCRVPAGTTGRRCSTWEAMTPGPMKSRGGGSVINISSIEGEHPGFGLGLYSCSKAAISMLSKNQAKEWGKYGIRSNAICPGLIKTKLSSALWQNEEMLEVWLGDLPIRRAGEPIEISGIAVYFPNLIHEH